MSFDRDVAHNHFLCSVKSMPRMHHSWLEIDEKEFWKNEDSTREQIQKIKEWQEEDAVKTQSISDYSDELIFETQYNGTIPVFDATVLSKILEARNSVDIERKVGNVFFNGSGCFVIKRCFAVELMEEFNNWCQDMINSTSVSGDPGFHHPNQKGKFMINDVLTRLAESNVNLLYKLLNCPEGFRLIHNMVDILLGFGKIGAAAAHWITPQSNTRQASHVDFPLNINSSAFLEKSEEKIKRLTTISQMNQMLAEHSCQVLIACDAMDASNGSTEVIPSSQKLEFSDLAIKKGSIFYEHLEESGLFENVVLEQGDVLFFNRKLVHRGGANNSMKRRNALIMQYVWLWGVGQENMDGKNIVKCLKKFKEDIKKENSECEEFQDLLLRIEPPYPKDTRLGT